MSVWSDLAERVRSLLFRSRDERELAEEVAFHLEREEEMNRREGLSPEAARRRARIEFGGAEQVKEAVRDARGTRLVDDCRQDLRYAVRSLGHNRGFALATIGILALGIGANASTFTLVDALMLRSLPVPDPGRLVTVGDPRRTGSLSEGTPRADLLSYPAYTDVREAARTVTGLYATGRTGRLDVLVPDGSGQLASGDPEHPRGRYVSGNFFTVLGVNAELGRTFTDFDDRAPGAGLVAVISHTYWRRRFSAEPGAVGRSISVNGIRLTVMGVMPEGFTGDLVGQPMDLWIPVTTQPVLSPSAARLTDRTFGWLLLMGRLAPGATLGQARAEFSNLVSRSLTEHATAGELASIRSDLEESGVPVGGGARGFSYYRSAFAPTLYMLSAVVGLVLLLVCANVANLMLARGAARSREMSIRLSLGAGRWRVVQQLLTESLIVALAGGGLALLVARWGSALLLRLAGGGTTPLPIDVALDGRVLAFTGGLSLATALLFGVVPALRTTRVEIASALRTSSRSVAGGGGRGRRFRLNRALVVAQVALSTVLVVGTGMMVRSLARLTTADLGLDRDALIVAEVDAGRSGYSGARLATLRRDLLDRVGRVAGVAGVSLSENGVFSGTESGSSVSIEGFTAREAGDSVVFYDDVGPGYFAAMGARILLGRDFKDADDETGRPVAVLNETAATFFFRDANPLGRLVRLDSTRYAIVGVVADIRSQEVRQRADRRLYIPMAQTPNPPGRLRLIIRAAGRPSALLLPVRRALLSVDPALSVGPIDPLSDLVSDSIGRDRMAAQVISLFGGLALLLAGLGLYGVLAYATVQRTNEFGLRMALGAQPGEVRRMVVGEAVAVVAAGILVGAPAAIGAARLFQAQWFGIEPVDLPSLGVAIVALFACAVLAAYLPARRAARIPPLQALRSE